MIIDNFNSGWSAGTPNEANAPLVVDPNTVLAFAVAFERFESVARRYSQIIQACCQLQLPQLAAGNGFDIGEAPNPLSGVQCFSLAAPEELDHVNYINA